MFCFRRHFTSFVLRRYYGLVINMRAAQIVQLHAHNGRMLTRPEILIEQFHEMRNAEQKKIVDEKMSEKMMMSRISSKLISMPSVDPSNL